MRIKTNTLQKYIKSANAKQFKKKAISKGSGVQLPFEANLRLSQPFNLLEER
jgi:hypothetical protein